MNWKEFIKYRGSHNHIQKKKTISGKIGWNQPQSRSKGEEDPPSFSKSYSF
jgi:hypothetical protein